MNEKQELIKFTPKQNQYLASTARETLFCGGRGSGKSASLMCVPLYYIHKPNYKAVIIRKNSVDLKAFLDEAEKVYTQVGGKAFGNPREFRFPSGAKIYASHLADDKAFEKIRGFNANNILLEEASQIASEELYLKILSSLRSTDPEVPSQIFLSSNTDGVGAKWLYDRFVFDKEYGETYKKDGVNSLTIFGNIYDNPHLMQDEDYVEYLNSLKGDLREQWLNGKWIFGAKEGAIFANQLKPYQQNIKEFEIDINHPVHTVWDLGGAGGGDDNTIIFYQTINEVTYILHSYSHNGEGMHFYLNYLSNWKTQNFIQYGDHWMPHDINVTEYSSGEKRLVTMRRLGYYPKITPNISIQEGIQQARQMIPYLRFRKGHTEDLLEALNGYHFKHDEVKGVLSTKPEHDRHSHYADAFRYMGVNFRQKAIDGINGNTTIADNSWSMI